MLQAEVLVTLIVAIVVAYKSVRFRSYVTKTAIVHQVVSSWRKLYVDADDKSFICLTGFDRSSFEELRHILFEG